MDDSPAYWQISNLVYRYAELVNLAQFEAVGKMFRHGFITTAGRAGERRGSEAVTDMYRSFVRVGERVPDTLLVTTNLQIELDQDEATTRSYFTAMHQAAGRIEPILAGRYHDRFVRIKDEWWFGHRHMIVDLNGDLSTHLNEI